MYTVTLIIQRLRNAQNILVFSSLNKMLHTRNFMRTQTSKKLDATLWLVPRPVASGGQGCLSLPTDTVSPSPAISICASSVGLRYYDCCNGLCGVYGCHNRAAMRYSRGLQTFPVGGHINNFLRLGGPNAKMNSIYLKYGEWLRGYLFLSYDAEQRHMKLRFSELHLAEVHSLRFLS